MLLKRRRRRLRCRFGHFSWPNGHTRLTSDFQHWVFCSIIVHLYSNHGRKMHRCRARGMGQTDRQTDGRIATLLNAHAAVNRGGRSGHPTWANISHRRPKCETHWQVIGLTARNRAVAGTQAALSTVSTPWDILPGSWQFGVDLHINIYKYRFCYFTIAR